MSRVGLQTASGLRRNVQPGNIAAIHAAATQGEQRGVELATASGGELVPKSMAAQRIATAAPG
jgi:hypothetical protein